MINGLLSIATDVGNFFTSIFGNNYIAGFVISMLPLIELKGGILYMIWQTGNIWLSFLVGSLGTSLPGVFLLLLYLPLFRWMKTTKAFKWFADFLEKRYTKQSEQFVKDAEKRVEQEVKTLTAEEKKKRIEWAKYIGLFIFTAIPLPMTGCWSASIVAAVLQLDYKKSLFWITLGNFVAGLAITILGGILDIAFFQG